MRQKVVIIISADFCHSSSVLDYICNPRIPSDPTNASQPLLQYLAIFPPPADCNLALLQSAPRLTGFILKGHQEWAQRLLQPPSPESQKSSEIDGSV